MNADPTGDLDPYCVTDRRILPSPKVRWMYSQKRVESVTRQDPDVDESVEGCLQNCSKSASPG